jgi:hypothetical protein
LNVWRGIATAYISLPDTIFAKTNEIITIPVVMDSSINLDKVKAENYKIYLRFDKSVLLPLENFTLYKELPKEKVIILQGQRKTTSGILNEIRFHTALGDAECSPIIIDSVKWQEWPVMLVQKNTVICFTNICQAGGARLYLASGSLYLSQNYPNPANGTSSIEFGLNETGYSRLILYDMLGNKVQVLAEGTLTSGDYKVDMNSENLKSGTYYYVLETPSKTLSRMMNVEK